MDRLLLTSLRDMQTFHEIGGYAGWTKPRYSLFKR